MASVTFSSHTDILSRVIVPEKGDLSAEAAESILRLKFDQADLDRMHLLAARSQSGELTPDEAAELDRYRHVGHMLDMLHSKARRSIKSSRGD